MLGIAISLAATVLAGAVLAHWLLTAGRPKARPVPIVRTSRQLRR
jgi:hypothetical protein